MSRLSSPAFSSVLAALALTVPAATVGASPLRAGQGIALAAMPGARCLLGSIQSEPTTAELATCSAGPLSSRQATSYAAQHRSLTRAREKRRWAAMRPRETLYSHP